MTDGIKSGTPITTSDNYDIVPLIGTATDYSDRNNWMRIESEGTKEVDLIYFYPTVTEKPTDGIVCKITPDMKDSAHYAYAETGSAFSAYTNVYAPYYTQLPISAEEGYSVNPDDFKGADLKNKSIAEIYRTLIERTRVRTDAYAALDYYFQNYNNGKPFILSGHSQGSATISVILSEYMRVHPEYLERMIAAYALGFPFTQKWMDANSHLKFAQGETDTGVIVSYNVEGANAGGNTRIIDDAIAINPINWKRDETPAAAEENKGKLVQNHTLHCWKIVPGTTGAVIDLKRGTVIAEGNTNFDTENLGGFGDKTLHTYDYAEYYVNLRENGRARCSEYLGHDVK